MCAKWRSMRYENCAMYDRKNIRRLVPDDYVQITSEVTVRDAQFKKMRRTPRTIVKNEKNENHEKWAETRSSQVLSDCLNRSVSRYGLNRHVCDFGSTGMQPRAVTNANLCIWMPFWKSWLDTKTMFFHAKCGKYQWMYALPELQTFPHVFHTCIQHGESRDFWTRKRYPNVLWLGRFICMFSIIIWHLQTKALQMDWLCFNSARPWPRTEHQPLAGVRAVGDAVEGRQRTHRRARRSEAGVLIFQLCSYFKVAFIIFIAAKD